MSMSRWTPATCWSSTAISSTARMRTAPSWGYICSYNAVENAPFKKVREYGNYDELKKVPAGAFRMAFRRRSAGPAYPASPGRWSAAREDVDGRSGQDGGASLGRRPVFAVAAAARP